MLLFQFSAISGQVLAVGVTAARSSAFALSTRVISVFSTADCKFELGDETANTSNSHFLPAGAYADISLGSDNEAARTAI
jgi:hypothetical protein